MGAKTIEEKISTDLVRIAWQYTTDEFTTETGKFTIGKSICERLNTKNEIYDNIRQTYEKYINNSWKKRKKTNLVNEAIIDKKIKLLTQNLNCIPMSPSKAYEHIMTYMVEDSNIRAEVNLIDMPFKAYTDTLNDNRKTLEDIFYFLVLRAVQLSGNLNYQNIKEHIFGEKDVHKPNNDKEYSRFIIRGQPGIGKTALLNYLFSVYANCLKTCNIIWIRVDLNNATEFSNDLKSQLYSKYISTFCSKYLYKKSYKFDDNFIEEFRDDLTIRLEKRTETSKTDISSPANISQNFIDLLRKVYDKNQQKLNKEIEKVAKVSSFYNEHKLNDSFVNTCCEELMSYIQNKFDYGFIIIFDGLDSVTIDFAQVNRFMNWISSFDSITSNSSNIYNAVYISTMRDYSYVELYQRMNEQHIMSDIVEFQIKAQSLGDIMIARFKHFAKMLNKKGHSSSYDDVKNIFLNALEIIFDVLRVDYAKSENRDTNYIDYMFRKYREINNDNFRAAIRLYRELLIVLDSIFNNQSYNILKQNKLGYHSETKIKQKNWIILRLLLFGDINHLIYKNRTQFRLEGESPEKDIRNPNLISINNRSKAMIPNIFNFREFMYNVEGYFPKNLCKIRIIQYLMDQPGERCGLQEAINFYKNCYQYNIDDVRFETRDMIYNGIIVPDSNELDTLVNAIEGRNYIIILTGLGKLLIENILYHSIYYEVICDDTPIQLQFSHNIKPISRYDPELPKDSYLIRKTHQVIKFYLYLLRIEKEEKRRFRNNKNNKASDYDHKYKILDTGVEEAIKADMEKYLVGFMNSKREGPQWKFDFAKDWLDYFNVPEDKRDFGWKR